VLVASTLAGGVLRAIALVGLGPLLVHAAIATILRQACARIRRARLAVEIRNCGTREKEIDVELAVD